MRNGYTIICPSCGAEIDDFSLCDEWFCDCGEQGIFEYPPNEDEEGTNE